MNVCMYVYKDGRRNQKEAKGEETNEQFSETLQRDVIFEQVTLIA